MESLARYIEKDISDLMDKVGAFYAFSKKQFDESKVEGVKYINDNTGLFIPKDNCLIFFNEYSQIVDNGAKNHLAKYGADAIIRYQYFNHEQQLSYCQDVKNTSTYESLSPYFGMKGFELENIERVFKKCYQEAIEHDYF